jgi:uncharacterized protein (TIGR03067 family)
MKTFVFSLCLTLVGACFLHAGEGDDLDRMRGAWQVVSLVEEGKAIPKSETDLLEVVITKTSFSVNNQGKLAVYYHIKLDPTKQPKAMDFKHWPIDTKSQPALASVVALLCSPAGESPFHGVAALCPGSIKTTEMTEPGIYTFEKDVLKLVLDENRKGRPTVFEGKETASYSVLILKKSVPKELKKETK